VAVDLVINPRAQRLPPETQFHNDVEYTAEKFRILHGEVQSWR